MFPENQLNKETTILEIKKIEKEMDRRDLVDETFRYIDIQNV